VSDSTSPAVASTSISALHEQVERASANYAGLPQIPLDETIAPEHYHLATPDRLTFALGWIIANQIVQQRFPTSAIDAIPIFHPERGWDRFLLTRRVSGRAFQLHPADEFGQIRMDGRDAPRLVSPAGKTILRIGKTLRDAPEYAIRAVLDCIPQPKIDTSAADRIARNERAEKYPLYYATVTDLILDHPGFVAWREIYIDDQQVEGQFHPLFLHTVETEPSGDGRRGLNVARTTWNWFQVQHDGWFAFFDRRGTRAIYRTDRQTWSLVSRQIEDEPDERVRERIAGWLRLDGAQPDPDAD
jgi:hypothetical protein